MSIPAVTVEVYYDGGWHTVPAADLDLSRQDLTVTYGRQDLHSQPVPTDVQLTVENPDAQWSPKDPRGIRFEKIGQGTPLRVRVGDPQVELSLPGLKGSYASTPDVPVLDITGDIDVRVDIEPLTWRPATSVPLLAKADSSWAWVFYLLADGQLRISWSPDGTQPSRVTAGSTAKISASTRRLAVRATVDVNNGASGNTVTFYTATTLAGPWAQLGAAVVTAGTTSIIANSAPLTLAAGSAGDGLFGAAMLAGTVYGAEVRNGIAGTLVASPDFTAQDPDDDTFVDGAGVEWKVHGQAALTDASLRGSTEIAKFLPSWNQTTRDARMNITGAGLLNSLGLGEDPPQSSLFHDLVENPAVVAYWPMEDSAGSTTLASGIPGHPPMTFEGAVNLAAYSGFSASRPLPTFSAPSGGGVSYATGTIPAYAPATSQRVVALMHVPDTGVTASNRQAVAVATTGTAAEWHIAVVPGGNIEVSAYDAAGAQLFLNSISFAVNGRHLMLSLLLTQNGANVDWQVSTFDVTGATGAAGATLNARTFGRLTVGTIGPSFDLAGTAFGHLAVVNGDVNSIWDVVGQSLVGWAGESAAARMLRRADETGTLLRVVGDPADTELLGPQGITELPTQLADAAEIDMGWFGERRDRMSLLYRPRTTLYNQDPALVLDMSTGAIANPFQPPLDDTQVRNDLTLSRSGGSSYRAVQEAGPNNINSKRVDPQGIGPRRDSQTLNLFSDTQLPDQATWRVFLSTVDEHRIAALEIEMEHHPELLQAVLELEGGDLIRILNPPPGLPPGPIDLIAMGWTDTITDQTWRVRINCQPGSPWRIAAVSDGTDERRAHSDGSTVAHNFQAGVDTTLVVASGHFEDFEDDQYVTPITGTWERTNTTSHAGSWSLRSPVIGDGVTADAVVQIPPGTRQVGFWYRISSEPGFDFFRVLVDSTQVLSVSGDSGWVQVALGSFNIAGASTITFRYVKDASDTAFLDAAFVDELNFSAFEALVHPLWTINPAECPMEIEAGGVVLSATAISGASSPQAFTVDAAPVNGIEKTIPAGTAVQVHEQMTVPL